MKNTAITIVLLLLLVPLQSLAQAAANADDIDGDGLTNTQEDANNDGLVNTGETDPFDADTDGGGEADGSETAGKRDPLDRRDDMTYDLDNDGLTNAEEDQLGTNRAISDTDGDGINDKDDPFPLEKAYSTDADADGLPDEYEAEHGLKNDVRSDANGDVDEDGLSNLDEFVQGTDIENPDSDNDGTEDGEEVEDNTDPMENPCLTLAEPGEVLHDLEKHWSKPYIDILAQTKISEDGPRLVKGYWTDTGALFLPDREVTRYEFLKMVLLGNCIEPVASTDDGTTEFTDFRRAGRPRESDDAIAKRRIIYTAYDRGIVEGYPDGTFRPDAPVNRAEALKILFLASSLQAFDDQDYSGRFSDVADADWFASYVNDAVGYAFIEGYPNGTFRPAQAITRAEAGKIVLFMMIVNPRVNGYVLPVEELGL